MIAALVALAGNGVSVILLRDSHAHRDLNMRSALLHMVGDDLPPTILGSLAAPVLHAS